VKSPAPSRTIRGPLFRVRRGGADRCHRNRTSLLPLDKLEFMQKQLVSSGALARPGDIEKMIDRSVREEALALLARGQ